MTLSRLMRSLPIVAAALAMLAIAPAASAAVKCPAETWDETTRTITTAYPADWEGAEIDPFIDGGWYSYDRLGCNRLPRPRSVIVTSAKAVDVDLSRVAHELNRPGFEPIQVTIDLRPAKYAPNIELRIGEWQAPRDRTVRLTKDGIDINGDAVTDIVILSPRVKKLRVETFRGVDDVRLIAASSVVKYDALYAEVGAGDELVIVRAPGSEVSGYGGDGDDTIILEGAGGFGDGGNGDDVINARKVRGGGGFGGGNGNDKLFLGPGNDSVKEEEYVSGDDYYDTGAGNDRIWDYRGNDIINSGLGNDDVAVSGSGSTGWDTVNLGPGNDRGIVSGKTSRAHVDAGPGNDTVYFFGSSSLQSTLDCGPGRDSFASIRYDKGRNCEREF